TPEILFVTPEKQILPTVGTYMSPLRKRTGICVLLPALCLLGVSNPVSAADPNPGPASPPPNPAALEELVRLRMLLSEQQRQLEEQQKKMEGLRTALERNKETIGRLDALFAPDPAPAAASPAAAAPPAPQTGEPPAPPNIRIGDAYITPIGFMDFTTVF